MLEKTLAIVLLPLLLGGALLPAQSPVVATSPSGFLTQSGGAELLVGELNSAFRYRTVQQIDATQIGQARSIQALHLRQSSLAGAEPSRIAQRCRVSLRIAHADWSRVTTQFMSVDQPLVGSWTEMLQKKDVDVPDLRQPPAHVPAPWSVRLAFDRPFAYDGKHALYVQFVLEPLSAQAAYSFDAVDGSRVSTRGQGTPIGVGTECTVWSLPQRLEAWWEVLTDTQQPAQLRMRWTGPPMAIPFVDPSVLLIGVSNPQQDIGLCAPLYSSFEMAFAILSYSSSLRVRDVSFPYDPRWVGGMRVYLQCWGVTAPALLFGTHGYRMPAFPARLATDPRYAAAYYAETQPTYTPAVLFTKGSALLLGIE